MRAAGLVMRSMPPFRISAHRAHLTRGRHEKGIGHRVNNGTRVALYPTGRREFHAQSLLVTSVQTVSELITNLHVATHTPWYITIPIVALGVNAVFRLPFTIYAQKIAQRRTRLAPLIMAWDAKHHRQRLPRDEIVKRHSQISRRLYKEGGLQQWKMHGSLLSLPFWLVAVETIRRMCGAPLGFLGNLGRVFGKAPAATDTTADSSAADSVNTLLPSDVTASVGGLTTEAANSAGWLSNVYEPSLTTGGCLWFPDLTVADPYHILPAALSVVLVISLLPKSSLGIRALLGVDLGAGKPGTSMVTQSRIMLGIHRSLLLAAGLIGVVTIDFPSAIHLYWLSSSIISSITVRAVRSKLPIPKSITPGKGADMPFLRPPRP